MTPEMRTQISMGRLDHYFGIMRTAVFAFVAIAAVDAFGAGGYSAPLMALVVMVTVYGILAGNTCLDDLDNLRGDLGDEMSATNYGKGILARNVSALKAISSVLIALVGLAELYAILT